MSLIENLNSVLTEIPNNVKLVAVSKTKPNEDILELYNANYKIFGENKVQELNQKRTDLPKDIEWHMIGHLQRNKVKQVIDSSCLIHGVDSLRLLKEINKEAGKVKIEVPCLLQVHIAKEQTKFGFSEEEVLELIENDIVSNYINIQFKGLMGMATNTTDNAIVANEFKSLRSLFEKINSTNETFTELSMGMSNDYKIAVEEGSTLIRIGSKIFGERNYNK